MPADRAAFNFDPRVIDWPTLHQPRSTCRRSSSTPASRPRPGKSRTDRAERLRRSVLSPDRHVAAFDLENTLIASNVVESYSWLATRRLDRARAGPLRVAHAGRGPGLLALDRKDRGDFLRFFYRRYEDAPVDADRRGLGRAAVQP